MRLLIDIRADDIERKIFPGRRANENLP